jgi:hypothetical protein
MKACIVSAKLIVLAALGLGAAACGSSDAGQTGQDDNLTGRATTTLTFTERCTNNAQDLWFAPGDGPDTPIAYVQTGGTLEIKNGGTKAITVSAIPWGKQAAGKELPAGKSMSLKAPSRVEDVADGDLIYEVQCDGEGSSSVDIKAHPHALFCGLGGAGNEKCESAHNTGG